ncbi:MAG: NAD(P)-dependent oxidoreductase, partial [Pseudoflavonifractor sp.]
VADLHIQLLPMEDVLRRADFLSLHTPLTPETRHLIGAAQLAMMKPSACLINASRGPVLDEAALCAALKAGALAGAGLDVFEAEPPQADNPLFALENLVVSPHNAALSDAALVAMAQDSAQGILDYFAGKRPEYLCNPAVLKVEKRRLKHGKYLFSPSTQPDPHSILDQQCHPGTGGSSH